MIKTAKVVGRRKEKGVEEWGDSGGRSETGSGWSCAPTPV